MHAKADPTPTPTPTVTGNAKPRARRKTIPKLKARTRKAKPFNPKNLAAHMKDLLEDQYIENVIHFYPPELIAMVEAADPELKEMIRNAAENSDDIAAICALVDSVCSQLDSPRQCAD